MDGKLPNAQDGRRTFTVIMDTGDEVLSAIKQFTQRERIAAAQITAIGALSDAIPTDIREAAHA